MSAVTDVETILSSGVRLTVPLAFGYAVRWIEEGDSLGSAAFWGIFVGLCHPVAGVAIGIGLLGAEVLRWIGPIGRDIFGGTAPDEARPLPAFTAASRTACSARTAGTSPICGTRSPATSSTRTASACSPCCCR